MQKGPGVVEKGGVKALGISTFLVCVCVCVCVNIRELVCTPAGLLQCLCVYLYANV